MAGKGEEAGGASLEDSFAYCAGVARGHYENFPVGSRLAPRALRPHVHSIYAFARAADDFADEASHEGRRLDLLDRWEERLDRCLRGEADHPVFVALEETVRRFRLPDRLLRDLLDAFRQDCRVRRYRSFEDLLDYCRRSANPVGRLVLHLYGYQDQERARLSDHVCTALQLTNFWQDVGNDLDRDRIYLPAQDRERHGVTEDDLKARRQHAGLRSLVAEMCGRTRRLYEEGRPLLGLVGPRLGLELAAVWYGGRRVLSKIEAAPGDVLRGRRVLTRLDRAAILTRAVLAVATRAAS